MKINRLLLLLMLSVLVLSSCMTTKTSVGTYNETIGKTYKYAKGKQLWLFWGLMPVGRTDVNTPVDDGCEIVTQFTVGDALLTGLTAGIVSSYTIRVNAKNADA